jgi:potassium/chloride transporter 4/5/6
LKFFFFRIQTAGLGGMKPNTIVLGWPNSWRKKEEDSWRVFVDTIRNAAAAKMALLVSVLFVLISIKIWDRE